MTVLTETWLKDPPKDKAWLDQSELMQNNFTVRTHNRPGQKKGARIALIHKKSLKVQQLEQGNTPTIKYTVWKTIVNNTSLHLMGLYHPPPNNNSNVPR